MDSSRVLLQGGQGVYEEKKSRFIATLRECESEEKAVSFIEEMRKKYWDARHNCYAYIVGEKGEILRFSDDGEPGGTAGRPMLEVLAGSGIRNVAAVVSRYFGGVLLGTGGLVRAYTRAVQEALKNCVVGKLRAGIEMEAHTDYLSVGKILHLLAHAGIEPHFCDYGDRVTLRFTVPGDQAERLQADLAAATGGKIELKWLREAAFVDGGSAWD